MIRLIKLLTEFPAGLSFISSICCTQQPLSQLAQCVCRAGSGLVLPLPLGQQQCVVPKLHGKVSVVVISTVCSSVVCRIRKAETTVALLQPGCFREGFLQWKGHWRFKMIAAFEAQPISAALLFFSRDLINAGSLKLQELLAFRSQLAAPSVKEDLCVWQEGRWAACNQDRQSSSLKVLSLSCLVSYPCWRVETCLCVVLCSQELFLCRV